MRRLGWPVPCGCHVLTHHASFFGRWLRPCAGFPEYQCIYHRANQPYGDLWCVAIYLAAAQGAPLLRHALSRRFADALWQNAAARARLPPTHTLRSWDLRSLCKPAGQEYTAYTMDPPPSGGTQLSIVFSACSGILPRIARAHRPVSRSLMRHSPPTHRHMRHGVETSSAVLGEPARRRGEHGAAAAALARHGSAIFW